MKTELGYILVVDDNEMNRDMLSRRLIKQGHTVDIAVDGKEGLKYIFKNKYDLILLDIMMPEISGLEVLTLLRKKFTMVDLPVIMVTAKDQSEDIVEALKLGANDYVIKPVDFPVANARIQSQLSLKKLAELKDEFVRIASHDLKNPLSGIIGYASVIRMLLKDSPVNAGGIVEYVNRIDKLSVLMNKIVLDFLDFQAMEDGQLTLNLFPSNINRTISQVHEANQEYASNKKIELVFNPEQNIPEIPFDTTRIQQVLANLVSNAIKFSPENGRVEIASRLEENLIVEVKDAGPGLQEEDMKKLFVKYARLTNKPTGGEKSSGLGLAISKKIIDLHKGKIAARNNPDGGTTFWFELPLTLNTPNQT